MKNVLYSSLLKKKKNYSFKYYFKNLYFINYKILLTKFHFLFNFFYLQVLTNKLKNYNINLDILKKRKTYTFKILIKQYINLKKIFYNKFFFKPFYKKIVSFLFLKKKLKSLRFLPDSLPFLNLLKTQTITHIKLDNLINNYGYIYLKSSGINTFITLTNSQGKV